ncbi:hypothetical protein PFISCL1PPCAC_21461 [Pristionchus fissidentatus]|uniref:G protein-coupled receptor n=1 Tax=Pristionchus fissidentatus TaxID=1538716 RepID=A0AAV5WHE9_9BILA|nr:hypothetical protein PFISCL1PPCAC_21461 [Pristionchus fissidentatus]
MPLQTPSAHATAARQLLQSMATTNLTLDDFWLAFMPVYGHSVAIVTHIFTIIVMYLMVKKTAESGKALTRYFMLFQVTITLNDLIFGVLLGPIVLYPAPAILCRGLLCTSRLSFHVIASCTFFSMFYMAMSLVFCFHYKYITIVEMTQNKRSSRRAHILFRMSVFILLTIPCILATSTYQSSLDGTQYIRREYPSLSWIFEGNNNGHAVDFANQQGLAIALATTTIVGMLTCATFGGFFGMQSLNLLYQKTSTLSQRTRKMQLKLTITFIIQMVVPFSVQLGPVSHYMLYH